MNAPTGHDGASSNRTGPDQTVESGGFRFSVLTDRLIRVEYSHGGSFEDRPTMAVSNRRFPTVEFTVEESERELAIDTGAIRLHCTDVMTAPTPATLSAEIRTDAGTVEWRFGDDQQENLGGTVRTLDMWRGDSLQRVTGYDEKTGFIREWDRQTLGEGFLSRSGWATFDDSGTVVLEHLSDRNVRGANGRTDGGTGLPDHGHGPLRWPVDRDAAHLVDLYLFGYGTDHDAALAAATTLIGNTPLPPRWAFGYWYSRYYPYTDTDLVDLMDQLDTYGIPVDVLVIDMDWHRTGWTGYSWDRDLFDDPTGTLEEIHRRGLIVTLNLHPADGIGAHEDAFDSMCAALGLDPATTDRIPFDPTDPTFVDAYFRILHHPEEDRGVDFWWLDWQQGTESAMPGLDPLAWLNQIHWDDQRRRPDRRPVNFSRWDGVGAARRPIGFSGDTFATWESLEYQPRFTATAANVLFGYWSHDIGGHFGGSGDPELYLRWIQWGAHSPVLRTHGSLDMVEERRIWEYPNPYREAMINAVRRRYELVPYIYSACALGNPRGRSLVRPMYHDHPDTDDAYRAPGQYLLGDDMIVSPVTVPADDDAMAGQRTWLPAGNWYDRVHGRSFEVASQEGQWVDARYMLDEVPVFIAGGSVIATQHGVTRNSGPYYPNLCFEAHPEGDSVSVLYEDDGRTNRYESGGRVLFSVEHRCGDGFRSFSTMAAEGGYDGWSPTRPVTITFMGEAPPAAVEVDGRPMGFAGTPTPGHWSYDPLRAAVVVDLGEIDLTTPIVVTVERSMSTSTDGLPGLLHRLGCIDRDVRILMGDHSRLLASMVRTGRRIAADPDTFASEVADLPKRLDQLRTAFENAIAYWQQGESLDPSSPPRATDALRRAVAQLTVTRGEYDGPDLASS